LLAGKGFAVHQFRNFEFMEESGMEAKMKVTALVSFLFLFVIPKPAFCSLAIMQGATNTTTTQIAVLVDKSQNIQYSLLYDNGVILPQKQVRKSQTFSTKAIDQITFQSLKLNTQYTLQVVESSTGKVLDMRELKALDTNKLNPHIAFISCMKDKYVDMQKQMWPLVAQEKPDLIFFTGDTSYTDREQNSDKSKPSPTEIERLWRRYGETRESLVFFYMKTLIPTIALWDDHDYGGNNSDGTLPYKADSKAVFDSYFAQDPMEGLIRGPGVSSYFTAFGQNFFLLDGRYFRSPARIAEAQQTHFGKEQEEWFFSHIEKSTKPSWIISGDQFYGGYRNGDSFEGDHPEDMVRFINKLKLIPSPVVFVSGDIHYSEIMNIETSQLGYPTFELTSSGIHCSSNVFWRANKNPRRMVATAKRNFIVVQSQATPSGMYIQAKSIQEKGDIAFKTNLLVEK
jgi:alkaline phosphatase D